MEHHALSVWLVCITGLVAALFVVCWNDSSLKTLRIKKLEAAIGELQWSLEQCRLVAAGVTDLRETNRRLWLRMDRLQNMVQERGWRDSSLLTYFDWKKPE